VTVDASRLFGVGISGPSLRPDERRVLEELPPRAVILFRRNLESVEQARALTSELAALPGEPWLCVDEEGGPVDRFRDLFGSLVSFREAAALGIPRRAGELAAEACRLLGFTVDLAPVVDRLLPGASERVLKDRCASADPEEVARAAREFLDGLASRGIGGCVKHFPGLGRADLDTHKDLPRVPHDPDEERLDLAAFEQTMDAAGAVMVSHAAGLDGMPASLDRRKIEGVLRGRLGFEGAVFSDDLEMGALSAFGGVPRRCVLAARAGCDLLLVCSRIDVYREAVEAVEREVAAERRAAAARILDAYDGQLERLRAAARSPTSDVAELREALAKLRDVCDA
jgi:beta-N-acetylhexosaminidase